MGWGEYRPKGVASRVMEFMSDPREFRANRNVEQHPMTRFFCKQTKAIFFAGHGKANTPSKWFRLPLFIPNTYLDHLVHMNKCRVIKVAAFPSSLFLLFHIDCFRSATTARTRIQSFWISRRECDKKCKRKQLVSNEKQSGQKRVKPIRKQWEHIVVQTAKRRQSYSDWQASYNHSRNILN